MPESTEPTLWDLQFVSKETGQVAGGVQEAQGSQTEDLKVWNFVWCVVYAQMNLMWSPSYSHSPYGICPKKKIYISLSQRVNRSLRWPLFYKMFLYGDETTQVSSCLVKCVQNASFIVKDHLIMESHLKQDISQRGCWLVVALACVLAYVCVCVCVGVSKATESWHTSFDVRSPVLVCRVAQQDDRSGDECRTVSKFVREGPLLPSVRAA